MEQMEHVSEDARALLRGDVPAGKPSALSGGGKTLRHPLGPPTLLRCPGGTGV